MIFDPDADPSAPGQPPIDALAAWMKAITPAEDDPQKVEAQRAIAAARALALMRASTPGFDVK